MCNICGGKKTLQTDLLAESMEDCVCQMNKTAPFVHLLLMNMHFGTFLPKSANYREVLVQI